MAKSLSDILKGVKTSKIEPGSTGSDPGVDYAPKAKAERDWVAKHKTEKHEDRVGNTDAPYKASTKYVLDDEKENKHGNKQKEAEAVYEATTKQVNDRMDSLMAAKKAEKAGDKKTQYQHLADYHSKYATHVKKPDDIKHHKSQAEKYSNAAKAFGEDLKCNMTNEGTYCPVHENTACPSKTVKEEKHFFHVHMPADDTRLHKMVDDKTSEPMGTKPKGTKLKITVPGSSKTEATNKAARYVAKNYGTNVKFTYGGKVSESLAVPLIGSKDDDESAEMAKTQLRALANKAMALAMYLTDDMIVEPWVQSKIAVAKDQVTAVHDYMVYGDKKEQTAPNDTPITFPGMNVDVATGVNV